VVFTRWGKAACPRTEGTEYLYRGRMAGSPYNEPGTVEYLCLHQTPQFLRTTPGLQAGRGRLYGTGYEARDNPPAFGNIEHHEAPCSVCYTPRRSTKITIPARTSCPPSWTREYYGYMMAAAQYSNQKSKIPVCIDAFADSHHSGFARQSELYFLETVCVGISCPPFSDGAEITCVVCTK
jgi:hypothetical protein